ncbi:receptor-type tyrosine-protein phosphatase-like N isoform X2 [Ambystoma mexicanum]|uniref:receptor-type tyrosine-protein phosphatase-like N isoform X2 n=1 Tax=Ambystoma mexicanum TaxID=8296 RepID=UPI0037E8A165
MPRLRGALVLCCSFLLLCWCPEGGARAHGCLFDRRLCPQQEICVPDGLFGRCQVSSSQDRTFFDVTPHVLHRMQDVLRRLMAQGFSWRDDLTQQVISQEMESIPKLRSQALLKPVTDERLSLLLPSKPRVMLPKEKEKANSPQKPQYADQRIPGQTGAAENSVYSAQWLQAPMADKPLYPGQRLPSPPESLLPSLLQQYLHYLLLSSQPERTPLGEPLLTPYHKLNLPGDLGRPGPLKISFPPEQKAVPAPASNRAGSLPFKAPAWNGQIPPHLGQPGQAGPLLEGLPSLYLPLEKLEKGGSRMQPPAMKAPRDYDSSERSLDFPEGYDDEDLDYLTERELQPGLDMRSAGPETDAAVQKLAVVLADYGVDLRELSDQQMDSLSVLVQLLQSGGIRNPDAPDTDRLKLKRVTEGDMQHGPELEPPFSIYPLPEILVTIPSPTRTGDSQKSKMEGPTGDITLEKASGTVGALVEHPRAKQEAPEDFVLHLPRQVDFSGIDTKVLTEKKSSFETSRLGEMLNRPSPGPAEEYGYILTNQEPLSLADGVKLLETLAERVHLATKSFINISVSGPALTFRIRQNKLNMSLSDVANQAGAAKSDLETHTGLKIVQAGVGQRNEAKALPRVSHFGDTFRFILLTFIALACIAGIVIAASVIFCLRQHAKQREKERLAGLGPEGAPDSSLEYQELCRQHMAAKSLFSRTTEGNAENSRVSSVSSQFSDAPQASPSSHSSTPSWCEEPVQSNMDISTGHMILSYMEDHLRNRDRLAKEWQALCAYQAEPNSCSLAQDPTNLKKSRNAEFVPYDHTRIKLKADLNPSRSDFINASPIIEHDPRMPAYIATQGPLSHTIADFWQMVWENGCTVIVMLSPLLEDGVKQCDRYWPDEGSSLYHIYEVNLVSEHIWCEDFLVRSFYLKNVQSQETRTLTQFHFLSWPAESIPTTTRPLLDFRRKVNKCYRGRSCPIIVHCSEGAGRTGTYILIDMVLNRMAKGVKEIDIAASLEHIRDQRPGMVRTKDQFEFALTAVAEEVNAILKALPQ